MGARSLRPAGGPGAGDAPRGARIGGRAADDPADRPVQLARGPPPESSRTARREVHDVPGLPEVDALPIAPTAWRGAAVTPTPRAPPPPRRRSRACAPPRRSPPAAGGHPLVAPGCPAACAAVAHPRGGPG